MIYDLETLCVEVKDLILDSLDKSDAGAECGLSTRLIADLDAESLDFLDIVFRIERAYQVKVERGRVEKELRSRLPHLTIKPNTEMTTEIRAVLRALMPEVPADRIDALKKVKDTATLFSVATFVRTAVEAIRESRPGARFKVPPAGRVAGFEPSQLGVPEDALAVA
jgi:acyl carrier protein